MIFNSLKSERKSYKSAIRHWLSPNCSEILKWGRCLCSSSSSGTQYPQVSPISFFVWVSQKRSVVSELSGPSLNRRVGWGGRVFGVGGGSGGQVRGTLSSSDPLFFLSLKTHRGSFICASAPRETGSVCITDSIHHLQLKDLSHL